MSVTVPSSHTGIGAWVNSRIYASILYNIINCHARVSHKHRVHRKLGLQLSLLHLFGILGSRCLTGSALLDCHVLKGFGIYMIGILDSLSDVMEALFGHSSCNLDM